MKIAFLIPQNVIGGGILAVYHHASYLKKSGHDILIIYRQYEPGRDKDMISAFELPFAEFDKMAVTDYKFDVIFATWWATLYDIFVFNASNYFYFVQDDERRFYENKDDIKIKFCNLTYLNPSVGIITVANWIKEMLLNENGMSAKVVPYGYNPHIFNPGSRSDVTGSKLRVLVEGPGKVWFKRVDDCFKALQNVNDIEVWFVSRDGFIAKEWHIDRFFVNVRPVELRDIYSACDVLLKMSEVESFCLPNLEMMACGGTIITTNFTGHEEYAVDGYNSIVIPIRGINEARAAVIRLKDDRVLLEHLKANALITARTMTWQNSNKKFEAAIEELMNEFKDFNILELRKTFLLLREIKLETDMAAANCAMLKTDYDKLFVQFHRNEYRVFRFIGRIIYSIPLLGNLLRKTAGL